MVQLNGFQGNPNSFQVPPALGFKQTDLYMLVLVFCNQFVPNTTSTYHLVSFQIAAIEDVFAHPCLAEHSRVLWEASDLDLLSP